MFSLTVECLTFIFFLFVKGLVVLYYKELQKRILPYLIKQDLGLIYNHHQRNISVSEYFIVALDSQEKWLKTICIYPEEDACLFGIV